MEKYGVLEIAADYCNKGKLEVWIQLFLRNDGHNIALAEGLLKEKRFYIGKILFELSLLNNITAVMSFLMQSWAELCKLFHNADST